MSGECGQKYSYRRSMAYRTERRVCSLPAGHAKRHGQKPEPTPEDAEPAGTCQICFREQQTRAGRLVLHGYKRPGWGYTVGKCWGCDYAPFQVSCERTKQFIGEVLKPTLARFEAQLVKLQARPESLDHTGKIWVGWQVHKTGYLSATVTVMKGEPQGYKPTKILATKETRFGGSGQTVKIGDPEPLHHPSYEDLLKREIQGKESEIRMVKNDIASFEKKVAEWKPVPWPPVKAVA